MLQESPEDFTLQSPWIRVSCRAVDDAVTRRTGTGPLGAGIEVLGLSGETRQSMLGLVEAGQGHGGWGFGPGILGICVTVLM